MSLPTARLSLVLAGISAIVASILACYVPFLPLLLFAAAALGLMSFGINLTGSYFGRNWIWLGAGAAALTFTLIGKEVMPQGSIASSVRLMLSAQVLAVWLFVSSLLNAVFRPKLTTDRR